MCTDKGLIKELVTELEKRGFYEEIRDIFGFEWKFNVEMLKSIREGVADDNVSAMIEKLRINKYSSAADALEDFRKSGLLKVEPVVLDDDVPSLMLGVDKYLHWFRGYYFQISYTHIGNGAVYSGADRMDFALRQVKYIKDSEAAKRFILVACLIPVLSYVDKGRKLLNNNTELLDKFLEKTSYCSRVSGATISDFMDCISSEEFVYQPDRYEGLVTDASIREEMRIMDGDFSYGLIQFCDDRIRLITRTADSKYLITTLTLPEWLTASDCSEDDAEYDTIEDKKLIYRIATRALMAVCGFRADYMCMYPIGVKRGDLKRIDYNVSCKAVQWDDIEAKINDIYSEN